VLAGGKVHPDREFYLAGCWDGSWWYPLPLLAQSRGIDAESSSPELLQQVVVEHNFRHFMLDALDENVGLRRSLIQPVSIIVNVSSVRAERLGSSRNHNPLGVSATGELMALDGESHSQRASDR